MSEGRQLGLFPGLPDTTNEGEVRAHVDDEERALAARVPRWLRLGTSSWSFPGWPAMWQGKPSERALAQSGLRAYAEHPLFRTVGLDRSYYGPLRAEDLVAYGAQIEEAARATPDAPRFMMVAKVWDELTTAVFPKHPRYGARAGETNPRFLDLAALETEVLAPYRAARFGAAGPFLIELTPMPRGALDERALTAKVAHFLERAPTDVSFAFELRNEELCTPRWYDVLRAHRAAPVFNYWTAMPSLREQLRRAGGAVHGRTMVARLMLPPFARYADKKADFAPFDRLVAPQPEMRGDLAHLLRAAAAAQVDDAFVIVNNKAEGCSPLTVRALAEEAASALAVGGGVPAP